MAEAADLFTAKKSRDAEVLAAKTKRKWLQSVYPATLAKQMYDVIRNMSKADIEQTLATMDTLRSEGRLRRWVSLPEPWEPDLNILMLFGSVPDYGHTGARRQVRCSGQLASFIQRCTDYILLAVSQNQCQHSISS